MRCDDVARSADPTRLQASEAGAACPDARPAAVPGSGTAAGCGTRSHLAFGCREMPLGEILELGPGDVVQLDRHVSDPVDLIVGDKIVARGEVVLVNGNFGLRVTEVAAPANAWRAYDAYSEAQQRSRLSRDSEWSASREADAGARKQGTDSGLFAACANPRLSIGMAAPLAKPLGAGI